MNSSDNPQVGNQLPISIDFSGKEELFRDTLDNTYKRIANSVNTRTNGLFQPREVGNSEQYFTPNDPQVQRNVYRMTVDFGALPNTGTKTVAHGITFTSTFAATHIYAAATDPVNLLYIPIPYASATGNDIELLINATNVVIITNSNRSNFTICYVVIEYCKTQ